MYYYFQLNPQTTIIDGRKMKSLARQASHKVAGCDDKIGPEIRFERYGKIYTRNLTCREMVFGVKAPDDGKGGGFTGLVNWRAHLQPAEVGINFEQARNYNADSWIIDFVREIINELSWTITKEIEI